MSELTSASEPPDDPRTAELDILQRVSWEINASLEPEEIYDIALRTLGELFDFHHAHILLLEDDAQTLSVVASRGYETQAVGGRVRVGTGVIGTAAKRRKLLHLDNLGQYRAYVAAQRREMLKTGRGDEVDAAPSVPGLPSVESQIAIPLLVRDTLIGVLSVESPVRRSFSARDRTLVTIVANQIASAIHNARLVGAERHAATALRQVNESLELRVRERTADLERELRVARELLDDARTRVEGPLLGNSVAVRALRQSITMAAAALDPVLLLGPPGAGKEAAARTLHDESPRRSGPFIHVDCSVLRPEERMELFGSGPACTRDTCKFQLATRGTLYLDSVHELPHELQPPLIEVIELIDAARAAGATATPDVRLVASTSRDLSQAARDGHFEPRLATLLERRVIAMPSLADRIEDIPELVDHFLHKHARRLGKSVQGVSPLAMERLRAYRWPGNIRELRTVIERALLTSNQSILDIDEDFLDGSVALGSYRLVRRLGVGGMGEVWLGRHQLLARPAAIKLIRPEMSSGGDDRLSQRFQREAQVTATLRSSHTVELYDFGISDSGTFYYVMELLHGMDLKAMVERFGPLPPERVLMLLQQACLSLAEAHEQGLVHRDIKPANLFVTWLGPEFDYLKVLDFGMVKAEKSDESLQLSAQGVVHGTPAFMAPEFVLGERDADGRADLYSLGCAAFWLLCGLPVFEAKSSTAMLVHHVQTPPRPPSAVAEQRIPAAVDALVMHCLQKDPGERPASALHLLAEMQAIQIEPAWTQERARSWWQLHVPEALKSTTRPE